MATKLVSSCLFLKYSASVTMLISVLGRLPLNYSLTLATIQDSHLESKVMLEYKVTILKQLLHDGISSAWMQVMRWSSLLLFPHQLIIPRPDIPACVKESFKNIFLNIFVIRHSLFLITYFICLHFFFQATILETGILNIS